MPPPIVMKVPGQALPTLQTGEFRYVVAREGIYRERATSLFTASTRVESPLPELEPHTERCVLHCRAIPSRVVAEMVGFFKYAYDLHEGEGALVLLYHPGRDEFAWHCPEQTVQLYRWRGRAYADDSIEFEYPLEVPPGWVQFGDAHSHVGSPHPSHIDRADEKYRDGLHVIAGNIASRRPSYYAEFRIDDQRFSMVPELLFEEIPEAPFPEPSQAWRARIRCLQPRTYSSEYSSGYSRGYSGGYSSSDSSGLARHSSDESSRDAVSKDRDSDVNRLPEPEQSLFPDDNLVRTTEEAAPRASSGQTESTADAKDTAGLPSEKAETENPPANQ
jgi:hypothetical protein